jgi:phage recombination protein Bet
MNAVVKSQPTASTSVLVRMASKFGVDADKMLNTLKATAFRGEVSNEQMMALLVVADQYELNPWTKEIYAFPDRNNGIVPVVGVDGWSRIINSHAQFDGMDFVDGPVNAQNIPEWMECHMHRKDRSHPTVIREYYDECKRDVGPWKSHPRRMLRHKAMIQCARLAFGFVGIYEPDEAQNIIDVTPEALPKIDPRGDLSNVDLAERDKCVEEMTDLLNEYGSDEKLCAQKIQEYVAEVLQPNPELWISVNDKMAADKIISKSNMRKILSLNLQGTREHDVG